MLDNLKDMMNMVKNFDTKKIQWFHQLMTDLRNKQLEESKGKLQKNALELYNDTIVSSILPMIEIVLTQLKADSIKAMNIIADSYDKDVPTYEVVEQILKNAKK